MNPTARHSVITTELVEETGVPVVDDALYSLVNALSLGVGEALRAVFLLGSYVDGSNAPDSDFDICLLLKEGTGVDVRRRAASFVAHLSRTLPRRVDPMYTRSEAPRTRHEDREISTCSYLGFPAHGTPSCVTHESQV